MLLLPQNEFEYYLTLDGLRTKLIFGPVGWDTDTIGNFKRDDYYRGLIRTLSLPLDFVIDGYDICKAAFFKYGYEAEVIFEVWKLERATMTYKAEFISELDFSQYDNDGIQIGVILMEGGVSKEIKAKENTKFEYALTGPDVVNIILPGVAFNEKADFIPIQPAENYTNDYSPELDLVNNGTQSGFLIVQNTFNQEDINPGTSGDAWFARATRALNVKVKGRLIGNAIKIPLEDSTSFTIKIINNSNITRATIGIVDAISFGVTPFNFAFDFDLALATDERLFLYITKTNAGSGVNGNYLKLNSDGDMTISYTAVSDPSNCKGIRAEDLYKRIIKRISPPTMAQSDLLKTKWNGLIITSGNGIREKTDAVIQITLREFFDSVNSWEDAGFGLSQNVARLELSNFFYRNTPIANIGSVKSCHFTVATDLIFNALEIGYNDGSTDDTDGQFEFNSLQVYQMPVTRIQRKETWVSIIQASQYKVEKIRVNYVKKTDDTSSDNDPFGFLCDFDGTNWNPILGSTYQSVTGMSSIAAGQSSYNLDLSPKHSLIRKGTYLRSILDKLDSRYIEFASAIKNKDLVTITTTGYRLAEKDSVLVSSLSGKYFKPIYATLSAKLPRNMMVLMNNNPFGYIQFSFEDEVYKGYIVECGVDLAKNSEREFKLLLTQDNPNT